MYLRSRGTLLWRFQCQRLPALISPLIDYVPRWIALLCLVVCIARRCQIVSSFVPGGRCVALQMLMRAGVLSWIKPGERFRSSRGSVATVNVSEQDFCMHFSSLYRRGVRSSLMTTCCLPSIFLRTLLLVRNSFLFLYDTILAMIGRGFSLFLLFCSG